MPIIYLCQRYLTEQETIIEAKLWAHIISHIAESMRPASLRTTTNAITYKRVPFFSPSMFCYGTLLYTCEFLVS